MRTISMIVFALVWIVVMALSIPSSPLNKWLE